MNFASLQHSVFLQALGRAILNSLWQGFILWIIFETVVISYKNASAKFKNNCSTILLFISFTWFSSTFISALFSKEVIVANHQLFAVVNTVILPIELSNFQKSIAYIFSAVPYLSIAYIFLLTLLITRLFLAYRHVYFISKKHLTKVPFELQFFADSVVKQLAITRKISIWLSRYIDVPATIGFIKPVILIPVASINNLSGHQLEAIILHELSHIKRNDYFINLIVAAIETVLFFNPFVMLLSGIMKRERENCCDDFVLQYQYDPHAYASALLTLEQSRINNLKLSMSAVSGKKQLLLRIKRITNNQAVTRQYNYGQKLLTLVLVTVIIYSLARLTPQQKKPAEIKLVKNEANYSKKITQESPGNFSKLNNIDNDENLQSTFLKRIDIKNKRLLLSDENMDSLSSEIFSDTKNTKETDNDFLAEDESKDFLKNNEVSSSRSFLKKENMQFPQSMNFKNLRFPKMNFTIDFSNFNLKELKENLKKAYKEMNSFDWIKLQKQINESYSQLKIIDLSGGQQMTRFHVAKLQAVSQLRNSEQLDQNKFIDENLQIKLAYLDSLISSEDFKSNVSLQEKLQLKLKKLQQEYAETVKDKLQDYIPKENSSIETERTQAPAALLKKSIQQKNIKNFIKKVPLQIAAVLSRKKSFQFSFNTSSKKSGDAEIINISLNSK